MRTLFAALGLACLAPLVAPAAPLVAQVEVRTGTAGRPAITNETGAQRARRLAPRLVAPPSEELLPLIDHHARRRGLDPRLVRAVVQAESGYNPRAVSRAGAMGLMQLMPFTARELAVARPFEPAENLRGGTDYLHGLLERFAGRVDLALAAYNAGPGAVERHGGIPPYPETREYVRRVTALWRGGGSSLAGADAAVALFPASAVEWRASGARAHLTNVP